MDEVNNYVFWRDFILNHLSPYLIGTKALELYLANLSTVDRSTFPGSRVFALFLKFVAPSPQAPALPSSRSLRFIIVPHTIQCAVEIWILETLSSRHLVDHLFSVDNSAHVFLLMEQRFQSELVR